METSMNEELQVMFGRFAENLDRTVKTLDKIEQRMEAQDIRIAKLETGAAVMEDRQRSTQPASIPEIVWRIIWALVAALAGVVGVKISQ